MVISKMYLYIKKLISDGNDHCLETNFIHKTTVSGLFESKQIMALPMTDWSRVIAVRMLLLSYEI